MHSSTTAPVRPAPTNAKSNFVSFPARSAARDLTVKSALLLALKQLGHTPPGASPLVAVSVTTPTDLGLSSSLVKKAGERTVQLDLGNNHGTIQSALFGAKTSCLDKVVLKKPKLYLDEAYLHDALKPWEKASGIDQLLLASANLQGSRVLTFSVNFGDRRTRMGSDPGQALRSLRNEIRPLANLGPVMMVFEHDADGRPHLHGMVQTTEAIPVVKNLLRRLGGGSSKYRFVNLHQVLIKEAESCMGWCHYMLKDLATLPQSEAEKHIYLSRSAQRAAHQMIDELTWVSRRRLLVTPERRGRAQVYRPSATGSRTGTLELVA